MKAKIIESRQVEKELDRAPHEIKISYQIWVRLLEAHGLAILRQFKGYHDENLKGKWLGYRSSRLNKQWRVIYILGDRSDIQIIQVKKVTPHDYKRKL